MNGVKSEVMGGALVYCIVVDAGRWSAFSVTVKDILRRVWLGMGIEVCLGRNTFTTDMCR